MTTDADVAVVLTHSLDTLLDPSCSHQLDDESVNLPKVINFIDVTCDELLCLQFCTFQIK